MRPDTGTATGGTTWNNSTINPGVLQASASAFASQNVSVVEDTGALETSINMASYNINVPALSLNYDSLAANAMPIIVAEHALSPSLSTPTQVSAQLTFDGTAGTTYYYSTSATGGSVLDHVTYDSFGNIVTQTNSTYADRFLFAGMEYDYAISYCSPCATCHYSPRPVALPGRGNKSTFIRVLDYRFLVAFSRSVPRRLAA